MSLCCGIQISRICAIKVQEDPDGDRTDFTYNLRFSGQYYDSETNLQYNYFRDYDPEIGRYAQSDPIGLDGGNNTFEYALSNPLIYIDSDGLDPKKYEKDPNPNKGQTERRWIRRGPTPSARSQYGRSPMPVL